MRILCAFGPHEVKNVLQPTAVIGLLDVSMQVVLDGCLVHTELCNLKKKKCMDLSSILLYMHSYS